VDIVSAGVHNADVNAGIVFGVNVACVRQPGLLFDGQSIHIGANQDGGTRTIFHYGDDAVTLPLRVGIFPDVLGDVVTEAAEFIGEQCRGFILVMRKLRSGVERLVGGDEGREFLVDPGVQCRALRCCGRCDEQGCQCKETRSHSESS
jgi:hypothetical protein